MGMSGSGPLGVEAQMDWLGQPAQAEPWPASVDSGPGQCSGSGATRLGWFLRGAERASSTGSRTVELILEEVGSGGVSHEMVYGGKRYILKFEGFVSCRHGGGGPDIGRGGERSLLHLPTTKTLYNSIDGIWSISRPLNHRSRVPHSTY